MNETIQEIASTIRPVLEKYGVRRASIFGSHARGEARPNSDIDLLVSLGDRPLSVWDFVGLKAELADCLHRPVDVVSDRAIVPYFRDYIYRDLKTVYEQR